MKTSNNSFKICTFILISFILMFSYGCGGGGGSSSKLPFAIYTISGKIDFPDAVGNIKSKDNNTQNNSIRAITENTGITVHIEQIPELKTNCDELGNFTIQVPAIFDSVNLIACTGDLEDINTRIQRTDDIILGKEIVINNCDIQLTPCKNTFTICLNDSYFKPIEYAKCSFWGFEITSNLEGIIRFPKFPENISKVKATIKASGIKEFTNEFSVFSEDLGPCSYISAYSVVDDKLPIIMDMEAFNNEPNPGEIINLSINTTDKSSLISGDNKVAWVSTDGTILSCDKTSCKWQAPDTPCLASITAYILMETYHTVIEVGVAVGKSRKPSSFLTLFYPEKAAAGQTISILGFGFGDKEGCVDFAGAPEAEIISWEDELIKVTVPDEAESGKITVRTIDGRTLSSSYDFVCMDYKTKLSCNYAVPGTEITLTGYGFGDSKAENSDLFFNDEKIENIISWTNRSIKFKVKELDGAAPHTANLDLIIRGRKRSLGDFSVSYIKDMSPEEATHYTYESDIERTVITLTGEGFGESEKTDFGSSCVKFLSYGENNQVEYIEGEVKSWAEDEIEVYLPKKAQTGNIILNINGYEINGPKINIIPASGYSELVSARFSESLINSNPLITGVIVKDADTVYLCDPENNRLWYLENGQYNYISVADGYTSYEPYTGAVNNDGDIIITDFNQKKLIKISDGSITETSDYEFNGVPMGLCISKTTGHIYVAESDSDMNAAAPDSNKNKIIVFDENLNMVTTIGSGGYGNGKFFLPNGLCLNSNETSLFVADSGNHRIQQFDITGNGDNKEYNFKCWYGYYNGTNGKHTDENEFGEQDDSNVGFDFPTSVVCDGSYIYVTDKGRNDIQKINITNLACEVIGEEGNGNSQFMKPTDIKLFGSNMYIADSENSRIQVFSKTGIYKSQQTPDLTGKNINFLGISMNPDKDSLYIVDSSDCTISKFDTYGTFERKIGSKGSKVGQLLNPSDVIIDKENTIWVADTGNRRLVMFSPSGSEVKCFGSGGNGNGQFKSPQRLACNSVGDIFVADCDKNQVLRFNNSGEYLYSIGQAQLNQPFGMAVDSSDNLYVCDAGNHRICKYDANNQFEGWFGLAEGQEAGGWHDADEQATGASGSSPCQFNSPLYLAIDEYDNLYVLDYVSKKIQKLDTKNIGVLGGHICTVEITDTDIFGIAVDDKDCFYVTTESEVRKYVPAP